MSSTTTIPTTVQPVSQFGRSLQVNVFGTALGPLTGSVALSIQDFKIVFEVCSGDTETPNTAHIRVYNLAQSTVKALLGTAGGVEYTKVSIVAGYAATAASPGNVAQIFIGTIKQYRYGKENNVNSFLDIYASDEDTAYNFSTVNTSLPGGSTAEQRYNTLLGQMAIPNNPNNLNYFTSSSGALARGKVMFGMTRDFMRVAVRSTGTQPGLGPCRWSIQNGVLTVIPLDQYLPNPVTIVNSFTGMVGVPEATNDGISVKVLLNPFLYVGNAIQINNGDITLAQINNVLYPQFSGMDQVANPSADGTYRICELTHSGDSRGQNWYTDMTCLAINPVTSSPAATAASPDTAGPVPAYPGTTP